MNCLRFYNNEFLLLHSMEQPLALLPEREDMFSEKSDFLLLILGRQFDASIFWETSDRADSGSIACWLLSRLTPLLANCIKNIVITKRQVPPLQLVATPHFSRITSTFRSFPWSASFRDAKDASSSWWSSKIKLSIVEVRLSFHKYF